MFEILTVAVSESWPLKLGRRHLGIHRRQVLP